jgi:hypothetical protein
MTERRNGERDLESFAVPTFKVVETSNVARIPLIRLVAQSDI